jgi:hypothetical protein
MSNLKLISIGVAALAASLVYNLVAKLHTGLWYAPISSALFAALLVVGYASMVESMQSKLRYNEATRAASGEKIIKDVHKHEIQLLGAAACAGLSILSLIGSVVLLINGAALHVPYAGSDDPYGNDVRDIPVGLWWMALIVALMAAYAACHLYQNWKRFHYILSDEQVVEVYQESAFLPWLNPDTDPTPFEQIVDVNDRTSTLGNIIGYGDVALVLALQPGSDKPEEKVLTYVRDYKVFADSLRKQLKLFKENKLRPTQFDPKQVERLMTLGEAFLGRHLSSAGQTDHPVPGPTPNQASQPVDTTQDIPVVPPAPPQDDQSEPQ